MCPGQRLEVPRQVKSVIMCGKHAAVAGLAREHISEAAPRQLALPC